jgi:hypothetical protein
VVQTVGYQPALLHEVINSGDEQGERCSNEVMRATSSGLVLPLAVFLCSRTPGSSLTERCAEGAER